MVKAWGCRFWWKGWNQAPSYIFFFNFRSRSLGYTSQISTSISYWL